ncbi:MAG: hypothetical protein N3A62_02560, partial [Thermodesulfovibrionales bacterium]|nr:hypothetical protein [Thermodesulfovibrionales bacterium]
MGVLNQMQSLSVLRVLTLCLLIYVIISPYPVFSTETSQQTQSELKKLQEIITRQQEELNRQAEQIKQQQELLKSLQRQIEDLQKTGQTKIEQKPVTETKTSPSVQIVTSGDDRYKIILSGQVNRAVNIVSDGLGT